MYVNAQNRMRMRIFNVLDDVKREHGFAPVVTRPADSPDFRPRVNWSRFHETMPLAEVGPPSLRNTTGCLRVPVGLLSLAKFTREGGCKTPTFGDRGGRDAPGRLA